MTLVVVNRIGHEVSFSSDSRISFGNNGYIDHGIKVFSVPVTISTASDADTGYFTVPYRHKLGLAVVGSAINAYTVKDSVYEMVQNLQYAPDYVSLSLDLIADIVFKVYKKTTLDLGNIIQMNGLAILILGGYCPKQKRIRVFKFDCNTSSHPIVPNYGEILAADGIETFGSGKVQADLIIKSGEKRPLHIIREVIRGGQAVGVGGGLQYGNFIEGQFKIYGVVENVIDHNGDFDRYTYSLRGINMYEGDFANDPSALHISYPFKQPFGDEV